MPDVNITPSEDGPYIVSGPVVLTAPDGRVLEQRLDQSHLIGSRLQIPGKAGKFLVDPLR